MGIVNVIDFLYVIFDSVLIYIFLGMFFDKNYVALKIRIPLYSIGILLYYLSSVLLPTSYLRTLAYLLVCLLFTFIVQGPPLKKCVFISLYAVIGVITESLVHSILMIFNNSIYAINREAIEQYAAGVFLSNIFMLFFMFTLNLLWQKFLKKDNRTSLSGKKYLLFVSLILLTICLFFAIHYLALTTSSANGAYMFLIAMYILITIGFIVFFMLYEMERLQFIKAQNLLSQQQLIAQEKFYNESIKKNELLRKQIHDEKNFLLGIRGYAAENDTQSIIKTIDTALKKPIDHLIDCTGNIALDTIISAKSEYAAEYAITIKPAVAIYTSLNINMMDLVLLLGNALDNAIEATQKINPFDHQVINLALKTIDHNLHIMIDNPVQEDIKIPSSYTLPTTKTNKALHGIGLKNIKDIVDKYDGSLYISCVNKIFTLSILLNNTDMVSTNQ